MGHELGFLKNLLLSTTTGNADNKTALKTEEFVFAL